MRRQGSVWLVAAVLALGAAACFSDPTKALRNGATRLQLSQYTVTLKAGDSLSVRAYVLDDQGNQLDVGTPTWTSADPTVATVRADAPAPGNVFANGVVVGINNQAGVTDVTVDVQGVQATVRVTVLPAKLPGVVAVTGTAGADTVVINRPAPLTPLVLPYTAGDTLVLNATATVTFTDTSKVTFGSFSGYIVARSATVIKAMSRQAYAGPVTVTFVTYAGSAATGPILITSIQTDSINIQHARFRGNIAIATSAFGPNTQMTITAPTNTTFSGTASVVLGANNAILLSSNATTLVGILPANYTGQVMVTGVKVGLVTTDSLRTGGAATTVNASFFPGTVTNGNGRLLDTVVVKGNGNATFTTAAATASTVTVNGAAAFIVRLKTDTIFAVAKHGGSAAVAISNVIVAGTTIPSLSTQTALAVDSVTTDEPNEPGNDASATATAVTGITNIGDSVFVYGAMNATTDVLDLYKFTMPAAGGKVAVQLAWYGTGAGNNDANPDFDVVVCTALSSGSCSYGQDLIPGNAASGSVQPEKGTTTAIAGSTVVYIRTFQYYATSAPGENTYQLKVKTTP